MPIKAETLHDEAALLKELFAKHSKLSQKDFAKTSDECFALTIQGRSMEPDFVQGDIIIVDPSISPSPGDFVVASRVDPLCGGLEVTFKKYRPRSYNSRGQMVFELSPLNPDYPTYVSDADKLTVIAVLVEHRRKFKHS